MAYGMGLEWGFGGVVACVLGSAQGTAGSESSQVCAAVSVALASAPDLDRDCWQLALTWSWIWIWTWTPGIQL